MPDIQLIVVGLIVAFAAIFLVRQWLRPWLKKGPGCGGSCGCGHPASQPDASKEVLIPVEELQVRKR